MNYSEVINETKTLLHKEGGTLFTPVSKVYPTTTENIKGYYKYYNFKDKDILTVCASGDHIFCALLNGAKSVDAFDINALTEYYFYLKKALIEKTTFKEFKNLFTKYLISSKKVGNTYEYIRDGLDGIYQEFWDEIITYILNNNMTLKNMFMIPRIHLLDLKNINYFDNKSFEKLKEVLNGIKINFIQTDITNLKLQLNKKYDYMFLSNISDYIGISKAKDIAFDLMPYIKNSGEIAYAYMYETPFNEARKYDQDFLIANETFALDRNNDLVLTMKKR